LPASMWAMIPMLRQRSNGACLGISLSLSMWRRNVLRL
jgi:hypothetical protein